MQQYILSIDQGTTSSRAIVFDKNGSIVSVGQKEFKQYFPKPGWVEHDANEIWSSQAAVITEAIVNAGLDIEQINSIGITNQRETTVVWDRKTGKPAYKAIVWQDRRTSAYCEQLKKEGLEKMIAEKTGLVIDSYFSATKIKWILDNDDDVRRKAENGDLAFGTIDSWIIWNITKGKMHITDVTNASRTMLFNIHTLSWDKELLKLFNIPESMLPEVKSSSEVYGSTTPRLFDCALPIAGIAGDQQAALFGQMCTEPGMVKNTYGTGCFLMMNTGTTPIQSKNKLLTTIAWQVNGQTNYALEGSIFVAGAVIQWLRDGLGIIKKSAEVEELAAKVKDSDGVYIVPAFTGLGAPYWNQDARGTIVGLTRGSTSSHIARAALDSIAYQTMEVVNAMNIDSGIGIRELRVDGGATANNGLLQFQSDILHIPVIRPKITETTALGAAYLAGLATGYWSSIDEIKDLWQEDRRFDPTMEVSEVNYLTKGWEQAIKSALAWTE
ncbi:glycerol kinase GlpK [Solitalea canadensis]|uniref:Glycerol kinase n=1 Tax=Solitalea canadensis (strain ATCC 29591 / DSM 3403 / JCM 21819 / LMG 8368 / NBRC 15130 / NCIMB 12057 / USAM 9D) TaxID=929556 RepID=H8KPE9_SOLCM|nr:glycerol kinase GlpK [Solitalea canadensis]AFD05847.1 glycerol kinase [Solitalea canadensis DSM 3403]